MSHRLNGTEFLDLGECQVSGGVESTKCTWASEVNSGLGCLDWEFGGFPAGYAAGDFAYLVEAAVLQDACGYGGTVAAGAEDKERASLGELVDVFGEVIEREVQAAGDLLLLALARVADVDGEGWIGG